MSLKIIATHEKDYILKPPFPEQEVKQFLQELKKYDEDEEVYTWEIKPFDWKYLARRYNEHLLKTKLKSKI